MTILNKLAKLASKLDQKGLYEEANLIDNIIKEAAGYQSQLAPGLLGPEDTSRMPAGGGAGGLPQVPGDWGPERGTPEWNTSQIAKMKEQKNTGMAGKGNSRGKNPKVGAIQQRYNELWDNLKALGLQVEQGFGPRLIVDELWGPKTDRAWKQIPRLQKILALQQPGAQQGSAGKGPQQGFDFSGDQYVPSAEGFDFRGNPEYAPTQPVGTSGSDFGASIFADSIWKSLVSGGKVSGENKANITQKIQQYMEQGMEIEDAARKVKQEYDV